MCIIKRIEDREWLCVIISSLNVMDFFVFTRMQRQRCIRVYRTKKMFASESLQFTFVISASIIYLYSWCVSRVCVKELAMIIASIVLLFIKDYSADSNTFDGQIIYTYMHQLISKIYIKINKKSKWFYFYKLKLNLQNSIIIIWNNSVWKGNELSTITVQLNLYFILFLTSNFVIKNSYLNFSHKLCKNS